VQRIDHNALFPLTSSTAHADAEDGSDRGSESPSKRADCLDRRLSLAAKALRGGTQVCHDATRQLVCALGRHHLLGRGTTQPAREYACSAPASAASHLPEEALDRVAAAVTELLPALIQRIVHVLPSRSHSHPSACPRRCHDQPASGQHEPRRLPRTKTLVSEAHEPNLYLAPRPEGFARLAFASQQAPALTHDRRRPSRWPTTTVSDCSARKREVRLPPSDSRAGENTESRAASVREDEPGRPQPLAAGNERPTAAQDEPSPSFHWTPSRRP